MGIGWCRVDPLLTINGEKGHLILYAPVKFKHGASDNVEIEVFGPGLNDDNVKASNNRIFGAATELYASEDTKFSLTVFVPAEEDFPITAEFKPSGNSTYPALLGLGAANQRIDLTNTIDV